MKSLNFLFTFGTFLICFYLSVFNEPTLENIQNLIWIGILFLGSLIDYKFTEYFDK